MFDPALDGYWGYARSRRGDGDACSPIIATHADKVDGIKVSLLDHEREIAMRRALPDGVRMYTGDDFDYPELIRGDEHGHTDALLGIFDAIAPAAAAALAALDAGDTDRYDAILAPTVPLSRHIFRAPTYRYKTGIVFLAYLNGHQRHFRMVGGQESARSVTHLAELFVLADAAGLLRDPELAAGRMRGVLALAGRGAAMSPRLELSRLSLNQITVEQLVAPRGDRRVRPRGAHDDRAVAPQGRRDRDRRRARSGSARPACASRACAAAASSPPRTTPSRAASDADNRRAVEEAAVLGTDVLVLVCGPPLGRDVDRARSQILAGIERLVPYAEEHGVRLAIEPLHPMMISERSAIVTLGEANDMAERFDEHRVGVVVDAYHVWWDPRLYEEIARAGRRIFGYHVADWLVPTTDRLQGRGMMGEGVIELKRIRAAVEDAGYDGPIEVEVINREAWARPGDEIVADACDAFLRAA